MIKNGIELVSFCSGSQEAGWKLYTLTGLSEINTTLPLKHPHLNIFRLY